MRVAEVIFQNGECLSRSTEHPLVDLSIKATNLIIICIADIPKIGFETNSKFKKEKYSYWSRTISMTATSLKAVVGIFNILTLTNTTNPILL